MGGDHKYAFDIMLDSKTLEGAKKALIVGHHPHAGAEALCIDVDTTPCFLGEITWRFIILGEEVAKNESITFYKAVEFYVFDENQIEWL